MMDYCVIGTGIRISRNPLIHPEGYTMDEVLPVLPSLLFGGNK